MSRHSVSLTLVAENEQKWTTAYSLLSNLALGIGPVFPQSNLTSIDLEDDPDAESDLEEIEEFHDENTMKKVYDVLREFQVIGLRSNSYLHEDDVTSLISALQNAGILFREIKH